ncbi:DUF3800 domain-containing protein [Phytoactinopolyspora endophytica]|uniref:DUF3800 domain-containing protein n=1 Tax=Phytoactinopolyspora endophytica TaxID=1642495 RepID=UPI0013EA8961|nr:DUF3800 domain-containing protein [Phytoactinopolyspora endophytica]
MTYLDESYSRHHYYIAALCCPDGQAQSLATALDDVVADASRNFGVALHAELHGHAISSASDAWFCMKRQVRARIRIYERAMRVIGEHDVSVILRGVDVARLNARYRDAARPHGVVLQHVMERVNAYARSCDPMQRVLLIADEIDGQDTYRQNLWDYRRAGTPGYRSSKLEQIVDTIHFAPSHASRLIQAVDLVAYMHHRRMSVIEADHRAVLANQQIWNRISHRVVHEWEWVP